MTSMMVMIIIIVMPRAAIWETGGNVCTMQNKFASALKSGA